MDAPSVGSAFVVQSSANESVLVGSYSTVKAATRTPGPEIFLSKGNDKIKATLVNWVEAQDLAVFTIPVGNLNKLTWVASDSLPRAWRARVCRFRLWRCGRLDNTRFRHRHLAGGNSDRRRHERLSFKVGRL